MNTQTLTRAATILVGAALMTVLGLYSWRAAFHSDELNVLLHASRFAEGDVVHPGRPGLLWLCLAPLIGLGEPIEILRASRIVSWLAVCATGVMLALLAWPRDPLAGANEVEEDSGEAVTMSRLDSIAGWIPALALLLLFSSGSYTPHSIELRTDTFTTPLSLAVLVVLWRKGRTGLGPVVAAAVLVAAAALISQKSLYNGVGLALAWLLASPSADPKRPGASGRVRDAAVSIGCVATLVGLWYLGLSIASGGGGSVVTTNFQGARNTAFGSGVPWDDKATWLWEAVHRAPLLYLSAVPGLVVALVRRAKDGRILASALVGATLLGTIFIHRGFFPYYIASIEPFLALPAAWGLGGSLVLLWTGALGARLPRSVATILCVGILGGCLAWGIGGYGGGKTTRTQYAWGAWPRLTAAWEVTNEWQMQLLEGLRRFVPESSPYVAGIGVVPGYREVAGYLTGDNRRAQRRQDKLFIKTKMQQERARFFIRTYMTRKKYLRTAEKRLLYTSYLPVHPNLYLHGARVVWDAGSTPGRRTVDLLVDGTYTLRFRTGRAGVESSVLVDGKPASEGENLQLLTGRHEVEVGATSSRGELWLLLGKDVPPPPKHHADFSLFPKDRKRSRTRYQRYDTKKHGYDLISPPSTERYKKRLKRHRRALQREEKELRKFARIRRDPED